MNADIQRIREARFFKPLPDRAFDKTLKHIHVRAYPKGETILDLTRDKHFVNYIGYVVRGRVLFLGEEQEPLGVSIKDEFFLARPFSIEDAKVSELVSASDSTMIVFVPKMIINSLVSASADFSELIEEIYESIFERAKIIMGDAKSKAHVQQWMQADDPNSSLSGWVVQIENRRKKSIEAVEKRHKEAKRTRWMWALVWLSVVILSVECFGRLFHWPILFSSLIGLGHYGVFETGSDFNIGIGIVGYAFCMLTILHFVVKWGIRKKKWKVNYKLSSQLHILFGGLAFVYTIFHVGFDYVGVNVAHFAFYALLLGTITGVIGQTISNQIPKTIRGDNKKLNELRKEQKKLQNKAELLMEGQDLHKTSILFLSQGMPKSFWKNIFSAPKLWARSLKLKKSFRSLGMGGRSSSLAADLLMQEYKIQQKIRMFEFSNSVFKRWMFIHKPIGWSLYVLALAHVLIVTLLA